MSEFNWYSIFEKEPPVNQTIIVQNLYGLEKPYVYCKKTKKGNYRAIDGTPRSEFDFEFWSLIELEKAS